ncbi:MAG TPA: IS481 family transposase [Caulobacteraceae bacterium]|jgi:transposase InsO family protein|nr:IS481 family transposase [Caulobacteraceae bacterium]
MAWREVSVMGQRREFVELASAPGANVSELCRRFGVSRSNGYKWLARHRAQGAAGLEERSRRPKRSPRRTSAVVEAEVLRIRQESNGAWGGRKIAKVVEREGKVAPVPGPSTVTEILRRHDRLWLRAAEHPGPWRRFERAEPNELWQMDFKGHFALMGGRCHPLTVLDDHSRYSLEIGALADEQDLSVRARLAATFRRYGLPLKMLADNGSPWGDAGDQPWTAFGVWLLRLGVGLGHGRPYHPQTQGKDERFHRSLKAEVLDGACFADLAHCQRAFDAWRERYNHERPHEALGMGVPAERYRISPRPYPESLPPIEYGAGDLVRKVDVSGFISFHNRSWRVGKPFKRLPVALRPTLQDGVFDLRFCAHPIGRLDLRSGEFRACGLVDDANASPTTPQAKPQPQI